MECNRCSPTLSLTLSYSLTLSHTPSHTSLSLSLSLSLQPSCVSLQWHARTCVQRALSVRVFGLLVLGTLETVTLKDQCAAPSTLFSQGV